MSDADREDEAHPPKGYNESRVTPPWFPTLWLFGDNRLASRYSSFQFNDDVVGVVQFRPLPDELHNQKIPEESLTAVWDHLRSDLTLTLTFDNPESAEKLAESLMGLAKFMRKDS